MKTSIDMKVVGYTYNAAMHCPNCTMEYARNVSYSEYEFGEYSDKDIYENPGIFSMTKAIELGIIRDSENNEIHPVFDTDEAGDSPDHCDDCGTFIDTSWTGETVNYAVSALMEYVTRKMQEGKGAGDSEILDEWCRHLNFCIKDTGDRLVMDLYVLTREFEAENESDDTERIGSRR
jgi:hypothetical protein